MYYDIFEQAEVMNFFRKVIGVIDTYEYPCVYAQIGNAITGHTNDDELMTSLTEVVAILYIFITNTLPYNLQNSIERNYIEDLKNLIKDFEICKEKNTPLYQFLDCHKNK